MIDEVEWLVRMSDGRLSDLKIDDSETHLPICVLIINSYTNMQYYAWVLRFYPYHTLKNIPI